MIFWCKLNKIIYSQQKFIKKQKSKSLEFIHKTHKKMQEATSTNAWGNASLAAGEPKAIGSPGLQITIGS